ncbi:MAG: PKD domain-containing protein, partial [Crocinitomicaceae bacterium]|nr:PKD domain-containing protein [Crocinitomicaceae bacterium]
ADFTITVEEEVTAGADNIAVLCNTAGTTLNLNTLLIGADVGGTWAETSGSGAFTPGTGVFDASGLAAGDYTFTYTVTAVAPCVDDIANFTVTVTDLPNAGADNTASLCNTAGTTLDLNTLLVGADASGTWSETTATPSGGFTPLTGILDGSGVAGGIYTFEYTIPAVGPCPGDVAIFTITIEEEVNAGVDNAASLCNSAGTVLDLDALLVGADAGGTWTETTGVPSGGFTPGTGELDASGVTAGVYTFDYTVTAIAPCIDDIATITITIEQEVTAGADNTTTACNTAGSIVDLNTLLVGADAGGTWTETTATASGAFTPGTGELDAGSTAAGFYSFMYTVTAVPPCVDDFAIITVTVEEAVDAGTDNVSTLCNSVGSTLDLNTLLTGADAGGAWTETSGTASGGFTPGTGILAASSVAAGTYTFDYTVTGVAPCPIDVATMTITIIQEANAGADNVASLCNTVGSTLDLNTLLVGADAGGTWAETSTSGSFTAGTGVFDAAGLTAGDYTFTYTIAGTPPCADDVANFTVTVEEAANAGTDNASTLCNSAGTTLDLNTLLIGADAGGAWTETTGVPSGGFTPGTGIIDASGVAPGVYTFDYTITGTTPCPDDIATITITIEQEANAGADNTAVLCNSVGSTLDLNTLLIGADTGGTWAETSGSGSFNPATGVFDASGLIAGTYDFTYTVTGTAPCVDDIANFTITVTNLPTAGADNATALCNGAGTILDLNTLLVGADAGGTWTETTGVPSGGCTPLTGELDASGVTAGIYTFEYSIPAVGPCPGDISTMTITIEQEVNAGADNVASICNSAGSTLDLNTLLVGADAGGTWVEVTGSGAFTPGTGILDADGLAAGDYTFNYSLTAVAPCVDDMATFTVTVTDLPTAGADNVSALCNTAGTTLDLNTLLAGADAGGTWSETSGTFSGGFTPATGILDASGVAAGVYTFEYSIPAAGPCPGDIATMTITIEQEVIAGPDAGWALCNSAGSTLDLNTLLVGADAGGIWTETTGVPSGEFTPGTGILDATGVPAGSYTFDYTLTAVAPCADDNAIITVAIEQEVVAGADNATTICNTAGTTLDLNTLLVGADFGGAWIETTGSGSFTPFTGVFDVSGLTGGIYTFTYTVDGVPPCSNDMATIDVTVSEVPSVTPVSDLSICNGEDLTIPGFTTDTPATIDWTVIAGGDIGFGLVGTGDIGTFTAVNTTAAPIIATVELIPTSPGGCVGNPITFNITVNPTPEVIISGDILAGCIGHTVNFDNLSAPTGTDCTWDFGDGITAASCGSVSHTYDTGGLFDVSLTVTSAEGCTNSSTITDYVSISEYAIAAFSFPYTEEITIMDTEIEFTNESINADSYIWNFGDYSPESNAVDPIHEFPSETGSSYVITLIAQNANGCNDTTTKVIVIKDIILYYVPNTFTPDGNDLNQVFKPVISAGIDVYDYHLTIFNRWGEIVFESYDPTIGWDGTYAGQGLVTDEVYVWQLEFGETMSDKTHVDRGTVSILK